MKRELEVGNYKIQISRSEHVQGDPLFHCSVYTEENSYDDCLQNEINKLFTKIIGCLPPLLTPDLDNMCNEKFNISARKQKEIEDLVLQFAFLDRDSECRNPCTKSKYITRYLSKMKTPFTGLNLIFDRTVDVTHTRFSIDGQTLLTKLGGAVSSGRTLLWILVSILGATQVISVSLFTFPGDLQAQDHGILEEHLQEN